MKIKQLPLFSKLKKPTPKRSRKIITLFLAGAYTIICAIIIIPQLDHQKWFPGGLGTTDLPASIDFTPHKEVTLPFEEEQLSNIQIEDTISLITKRITLSQIIESKMEISSTEIVLNVPSDVSDQTLNYIVSPGNIEFSVPKLEVNFEDNPVELFNEDNFNASNLTISGIEEAVVIDQNEQYTYIELRTTADTTEEWEKLAASSLQGNVGFSIDGAMTPAWMIPPDGTNTTYVTLVIPILSPDADLIVSYLNEGPLPVGNLAASSAEIGATYSQETLSYLYGFLIILGIFTAIVRNIMQKETYINTLASMLIIAGSVAVLKFTGIPVSLIFLLSIAFYVVTILMTPTRSQLFLFIYLVLLSIPFRIFGSTDIQIIGRMMIVFGMYGLISIFFYQFTNVYEEK